MTVLRAGVVGLGAMGRNYVRVLQAVDGVELVAVADLDVTTLPGKLPVPIYLTCEELIGHGVDFVVVAVPTADHVQVGLTLAEAGVPALIEKPLAETSEGAEELCRAFSRSGVLGSVGHIERCNPALLALRSRLCAGEAGELFQIATRRQGPFPHRVRDVGVVKDLATHDIDLTAWVAGSPYASLFAQTASKSGRKHEDVLALTGHLADGTLVNHLVNWLTPLKERVTVVTGERGCFVADTLSADLTFFANAAVPTEWSTISQFRGVAEGDMIRFAIPKPEPLVVQVAAFRDAIMGRPSQCVTMEEGLQAVVVAEAALRSAETGTAVTFRPSVRSLTGG